VNQPPENTPGEPSRPASSNEGSGFSGRSNSPKSIRFTDAQESVIWAAMKLEDEVHFGTAVKKFALQYANVVCGGDPSYRHPVAIKVIHGLNRLIAGLRALQLALKNSPENGRLLSTISDSLARLSINCARTLREAEELCRELRVLFERLINKP